MQALEKLLKLYNDNQLKEISVNINILKPNGNSMKVVTSNKIAKGSLEIKDHKFFLSIPKANYEGFVCIEYIDFDFLELIDVAKMPRKLLVFDVELPTPF